MIIDQVVSLDSKPSLRIGGATVNVAIRLARKGIHTFYMTKIGTDEMSQFAKQQLYNEGIDLSGIIQSNNKALCKVTIVQENGERHFQSYENETPHIWLNAEELIESIYSQSHISYFGSGTLFHESAKKASLRALALAKKHQHFIVMDANIRLKRWKSEDECRKTVIPFLKEADLIKMTEEELLFLSNTLDLKTALQQLSSWCDHWMIITRGHLGATLFHQDTVLSVQAPIVKAVDTTGAGDAFLASILHDIHKQGLPIDKQQWKEVLLRANEEGAQAVTIIGAY